MTLERRDLWRGYTSPKHLSNTLLPFHDVVQINSHQKRMLAVTMPAMNNDIIYRQVSLLEMISVAAHYSSITAVIACLDLSRWSLILYRTKGFLADWNASFSTARLDGASRSDSHRPLLDGLQAQRSLLCESLDLVEASFSSILR